MYFVRLVQLIAVVTFSLAVVGCAGSGPLAQADPIPPVYTLGTGDKIRVTVFGEETLTGEYTIGPDGSVAMPLIGNVPARDQTPTQLQAAIAAKLTPDYILDPRVSIDVLSYRPFYILGEVNKPGEYPYAADQLTVAQAVAVAGGYTYRANTKVAYIRHKDEQVETGYAVGKGAPVWVRPGDTIRIGERYF